MSTGATVEIERVGHVYDPVEPHAGLADVFTAACTAIGRPYEPEPTAGEVGGSTDFGNVSQLVPGLHADMAIGSWPAVNHQHEFAAACITPAGDKTMLDGAKALALTAIAVARNPSVLRR
jgi:metal-dependent amidase/aminoacylase/carboxypeptidase family protein